MANRLEAMQERVNSRSEISMNVMTSQMNSMIANFNRSMKVANDNLSSGIKNILDQSSNFFTPISGTSTLSKTLTTLLNQDNTQFLIPLLNNSKFNNQIKELGTKQEQQSITPPKPDKIELPDTSKLLPDPGPPGLWKSFKDGSLKGMWQSLIADIRQFKGVVALTAITMAAFEKESKINELRTFTDGLDRGSQSLKSFKSVVSTVAVQSGMSFGEIADRAANVKKVFDLSFDSDYFKEYLLTQTLVTKSTGISEDVLNSLFLSIRMGTRDEESWIKMTKNMSATLVTLSGKTGMTNAEINDYAKNMARLVQYMTAAGAPPEALKSAEIQWSRLRESFGKEGLGSVADQFHFALGKFKHDDKARELLFSRFRLNLNDVDEALRSGNFEGVLRTGIDNMLNDLQIAVENGKLTKGGMREVLVNAFGEEPERALEAVYGAGKFPKIYKDLFQNINTPIKDGADRINQVMSSIPNSLKSMRESFHNLLGNLGEEPLKILASSLERISKLTKDWHTSFQALPESTKSMIGGIGAAVVGLTAAIPVFLAVKTAIAGIGLVSSTIGAVGIVGSGPIGWAIALAGALALVVTNWDLVKSTLSENGLKQFATDAENISVGLTTLATGLNNLGVSIVDYFKSINDQYPALKKLDEWTSEKLKRLAWAASGGELLSNIGKSNKDFGQESTGTGWWSRTKAGIYSALGRKDLVEEEQIYQKGLKASHAFGEQSKELLRSSLLPGIVPSIIPQSMLIGDKSTINSPNILQSLQEGNKPAISEIYKENIPIQAIEKTKVEPLVSNGKVTVENLDLIYSLAKEFLDLYRSDKNKPESTRTPRIIQPMTYSEAEAGLDHLTHTNGSWGTN